MNNLILIPEIHIYCIAILATWCLGSSCVATHIYTRWFAKSAIHPLLMQAIVKGLIAVAGLIIISWRSLFESSLWTQMACIPLGLIGGWVYVQIELKINRSALRKQLIAAPKKLNDNFFLSFNGPKGRMASIVSKRELGNKVQLKKLHDHYAAHESKLHGYTLPAILLVACFEEILFRGYLTQLSFMLPSPECWLAILVSVIIFGASHASFGLSQIIAKTILGCFCMAATLMSHTLVPAILMHGFLNWSAYQKQQEALPKNQPIKIDLNRQKIC